MRLLTNYMSRKWANYGKRSPVEAERGLLGAIISRAVMDAEGAKITYDYYRIKFSYQEDAVNWLTSDSTEPWSFSWCCVHLGFCPKYMQRKIREIIHT